MRNITIEHREGKKWYALKLEDFAAPTLDSEARGICEQFCKETGDDYRAKRGAVVIYDTTNHQYGSNKLSI